MFEKILMKILDFLFPAHEGVKKIEGMGAGDLVRLLPASTPSMDAKLAHADTTTIFSYSDERVKKLVWEIKYYRNQKITDTVGALIAEKIIDATSSLPGEKFFLVPIPLTRERLRERGYNHTELLAKASLTYLPKNFELAADFLKKVRHTPKQSSIESRDKRFLNIAGAFTVPRPEFLQDKHIQLIDDVVTTGATTAEAKRVLISAGAKTVRIFAIAH